MDASDWTRAALRAFSPAQAAELQRIRASEPPKALAELHRSWLRAALGLAWRK